MPAMKRLLATSLALSLLLSTAGSTKALQPPDFRAVDLLPGSGSSNAFGFYRWSGWDYFATSAVDTGTLGDLWRTNGTSFEQVASDLRIGFSQDYEMRRTAFVGLGSWLYFAADDGSYGMEIWRTNGTTTSRVTDIAAGVTNGLTEYPEFVVYGSYLYFAGYDPVDGNHDLYRTNGTTTARVKNFPVGDPGYPSDFKVFDGKLYFSAETDDEGWELWRTDGTSDNTVGFDLVPGTSNSSPSYFVSFASRLFFAADGELWSLTSTSAPAKVRDINLSGTAYVHSLTVVGDRLYFSAQDDSHGRELWVSTGDIADPDSTSMVSDINPDGADSDPRHLVAFGTRVYFTATSTDGRTLWSSNGLEAGTSSVEGSTASVAGDPRNLVVFAGALYWNFGGGELWRTDGPSSAVRQTMLPLAFDDSVPWAEELRNRLTVAGDKLYIETEVLGAGQEFAWAQAPAAPTSTTAPTIAGTAKVSKTLTATRGVWAGLPTPGTTLQWYRCSAASSSRPATTSVTGCVAISGATKVTYRAVTADKAKYLRVRVKALNESGTVYRWSSTTVKVAP
jgi:ELWxxDGT repeat protein